jgi:hypothetical protein
MGVYLINVDPTDVHLMGVYLVRVSHRRVLHGRASMGMQPICVYLTGVYGIGMHFMYLYTA